MAKKLHPRLDQLETKFDGLETKFDRMEQTNHKILDVLSTLQNTVVAMKTEMVTKSELNTFKSEMSEFKVEMSEFKVETEEKFEFMIENVVTKTEFKQTVDEIYSKMSTMATKADLLHFTDRFDTKFTDLKHDIIIAIRGVDKKFSHFAT